MYVTIWKVQLCATEFVYLFISVIRKIWSLNSQGNHKSIIIPAATFQPNHTRVQSCLLHPPGNSDISSFIWFLCLTCTVWFATAHRFMVIKFGTFATQTLARYLCLHFKEVKLSSLSPLVPCSSSVHLLKVWLTTFPWESGIDPKR